MTSNLLLARLRSSRVQLMSICGCRVSFEIKALLAHDLSLFERAKRGIRPDEPECCKVKVRGLLFLGCEAFSSSRICHSCVLFFSALGDLDACSVASPQSTIEAMHSRSHW